MVADRYEWEGKERTMEDLKDRYYSGVRKLLAGRTPESLMTVAQLEQYNSYKWDKGILFTSKSKKTAKEIERKVYVENLFKRTPEQIAEENALMAEVKRIEAYDKKTRAEREELISLLESPRSIADTRGYEGSQGMNILHQTLIAADKTKAKQQQRKSSVSQATAIPGSAAAADSAMNARDEVTRRFKRFSPKEGLAIWRLAADCRICLWYCISREDRPRSATQISETHHIQTYHCPESIQCVQGNWTFREDGHANNCRLRENGEITECYTTYAGCKESCRSNRSGTAHCFSTERRNWSWDKRWECWRER